MPTSKQRRDAARRRLERQLQRRQERERARRRFTLVASVVGSVVLVVVIILVIALSTGNSKKSSAASSGTPTPTSTPTVTTPTPTPTPSTSYKAAKGAAVTFDGVTVKGAADLKGVPYVTSKSSTNPAKLEVKDLVVGNGAAAKADSTVTVQYVGALYKNGKVFDASWSRGSPTQFSLTGVIKGFTQGIGGTTGIAPMKVGGRRIIIIPSALGYGSQASGPIPANSALVFVVDLVKLG